MEEVLEWVARIVKFIPVFRDLWTAVKANNTNQQFAMQLEMVRQIREQQAKEEFLLDISDEPTNPGA